MSFAKVTRLFPVKRQRCVLRGHAWLHDTRSDVASGSRETAGDLPASSPLRAPPPTRRRTHGGLGTGRPRSVAVNDVQRDRPRCTKGRGTRDDAGTWENHGREVRSRILYTPVSLTPEPAAAT